MSGRGGMIEATVLKKKLHGSAMRSDEGIALASA
jgi:hypothetical protein